MGLRHFTEAVRLAVIALCALGLGARSVPADPPDDVYGDVVTLGPCVSMEDIEAHAGRLVRVEGAVLSGFEASLFLECGSEWWLRLASGGQLGSGYPPAGVPAILGASFDEFSEWARSGSLADPQADLPWEIAEAVPPLEGVEDRRWRRLRRAECAPSVEVIGRLDHLPGPGFITPSDRGFVWQSSGFGHMDLYPVQMTVVEVLKVRRFGRCPTLE
ncbi:MAG: hypothetical protein AAGM22_07510 [Acidobacteriota bacterium]